MVASGLAVYAFKQHKARTLSDALAAAEAKVSKQAQDLAASEATRRRESEEAEAKTNDLNAKLKDSLQQTENAKKQAETFAQLFQSAMQSDAAAKRAANVQLDKEAALQRDLNAKQDVATLDRDTKELDAARKSLQEISADAARKSEQAFAAMGAVHIISTNRISRSDLFDVTSGSQVTASSPGRNTTDMFDGAQGSSERATVFADGKPVDSTHWIEWHTKSELTVKSVAIFAAHDPLRYRRAFSNFKLLAKKQNKWVEIAQYSPSLPYGGSCASNPCLPPNINFAPGTVLAACINIKTPVAANEFRAEFVQAVSALEFYSGPRVLQLDGYKKPDCSN